MILKGDNKSMKIGVLIELFKNTNIDERFAELRSMGMESCQLVCWDRDILHDDHVAEAVNKAVEKHGVHITAFWCGWKEDEYGIFMKDN